MVVLAAAMAESTSCTKLGMQFARLHQGWDDRT